MSLVNSRIDLLEKKIDKIIEILEQKDFEYNNKLQMIKYNICLNNIIKGYDPRIVLLRDGYIFSESDIKSDVFKYIADGTCLGGYPITLKINEYDCKIIFEPMIIKNVTGTFYGAVCFNTEGLLFYINFNRDVILDNGDQIEIMAI